MSTTPPDAGKRHGWRKQRPDVEVQDLRTAIDRLPLKDESKQALDARFLGQLGWMQSNAQRNRFLHSLFRLTAIIGGVTVPALVSLNLKGGAGTSVRWVTFGISLLAAISAAIDEFFAYGDKWRHFRRIGETLKSEGWSFVQLSGQYRGRSHAGAVAELADAVERISQEDRKAYLTTIVAERDAGLTARGTPR
jgi:hypothetical protein